MGSDGFGFASLTPGWIGLVKAVSEWFEGREACLASALM